MTLQTYNQSTTTGRVRLVLKPKSGPQPKHSVKLVVRPQKESITKSSKLRTISLFSGIGGFELGLASLVDVCLFAEKDPYCRQILEKRFPKIPIIDDVRNEIPRKVLQGGPIECILAGFPCQDISQAGKGVGLTGKRSGLISEVFRLTNQLQPNCVFLENVQLLRKRGLSDVISTFAEAGYDTRWITLSVIDVGGLHRRNRMFILAWKRGSFPIFLPINQKSYVNWCLEPNISRVLDHPATKLEKKAIRSLGNSIVPAQAHEAFVRLTADDFTSGCVIYNDEMPQNGEYLESNGKIFGRKSRHIRLPQHWPITMQRFKTTHSLPTPTASDAIIRKPTNTQKSRAFRPGVNKSVSLNRWVCMFPTRETTLPPINDEGYLIDNESFSGGKCPNPEWVTWVMGYPEGWLKLK